MGTRQVRGVPDVSQACIMQSIAPESADGAPAHVDRLEQLIGRAKTGSDSALGQALTECQPVLFQTARRAVSPGLRPIVGASDIVQDTFVNATKSIRSFRGKRTAEFLSWLRAILFRRIAEIARRRDNRADEAAGQPVPGATGMSNRRELSFRSSASSIVMREEATAQIRAGLARLSERDQTVLNLRFNDGLTFPQIGAKLCTSEDAARMLFSRAVERLRRELTCDDSRSTPGAAIG